MKSVTYRRLEEQGRIDKGGKDLFKNTFYIVFTLRIMLKCYYFLKNLTSKTKEETLKLNTNRNKLTEKYIK